MIDGFIKTVALTPKVKVADINYNKSVIIDEIKKAIKSKVKLLVMPELCLSAYTCGDLFLQSTLQQSVKNAIIDIAKSTKDSDIVVVFGSPLVFSSKLYNCAIVISNGKILGVVPKTNIPNYAPFIEKRYFENAPSENKLIKIGDDEVIFGTKILFQCENMQNFCIGIEICEDLWVPISPSSYHAIAGATIICNLSASNEIVGKQSFRNSTIKAQSLKLCSGYVYADAGMDESTTDLIFSGNNFICENGKVLSQSKPFESGIASSEIDVDLISSERIRKNSFPALNDKGYQKVYFSSKIEECDLTRQINANPFISSDVSKSDEKCNSVLNMQSYGLVKRITHTNTKKLVVGISGGLDSCLALLVCANAFDILNMPRKDIVAITMPGFGTTGKTKNNALDLCKELSVSLKEIPIIDSVLTHFKDIEQSEKNHDVTYENAQARERTQILMDYANKIGGLVIGTGDLSELALGWATYNGDHMSMYGVNGGVPKTLVKKVVDFYAKTKGGKIEKILKDIINTPISPELIPPKDGEITQKTEDLVGPYELHDFFIFYALRYGFSPKKIYRLALIAHKDNFDKQEIKKWLISFYKRFFAMQFKRSCLPDGVKIGSVGLSPRGDFMMPSDAISKIWLDEAKNL